MLDLSLHLLDALQVKIAALSNGIGRVLRHNPCFSQGEAGRDLHLQPAAVFIFISPDAAHFRAGITGNHKICGSRGTPMINAGRPPRYPCSGCRIRDGTG